MKLKLMSAVVMGLGLGVAAPVLACPGAEANTTAAVKEQKGVTLTGVVTQEGCPMDAAEMGCTGYVLTADKGGDRFMITKTQAAEKMLTKVKDKSRVKVTGDIADKDGKAVFSVAKFKPVGSA